MCNMGTNQHTKYPLKHTLPTCNMGKPSGILYLVEVQAVSFPCWTPVITVSLNDAYLVRYKSEVPGHNHFHMTDTDILGWRNPKMDPGVFYSKGWSKIFSYLSEHKMWPKFGILRQWQFHTKLKKTSKILFAVLSSSCSFLESDF